MKRYDLLTPEGTKDYLFKECKARRHVEKTYEQIFKKFGYSEVVTPGIEYFDLFSQGGRAIAQEKMYKLLDSNGRLIVVRPDSTIPIARMVSTRLKDAKLPIRLFYNQSVYSVNKHFAGRSDEILQSGIELIGSNSKKSDLEVLFMAIMTLSAFSQENINDFTLEIGHIGVFKHLVDKLNLPQNLWEEIRVLIEGKNYPALNDLLDTFGDNKITRTLKQLPRLFGGVEVFDKLNELYYDEELSKITDDLRAIYDNLVSFGFEGKILVDLSIVNRTDYYTGIVFHGYLGGFGEPVLTGGRYDNLLKEFDVDLPATGFGVNINAVSNVLSKLGYNFYKEKKTYLIYFENCNEMKTFFFVEKLKKIGPSSIEFYLENNFEECKKYAKENEFDELIYIDKDFNIDEFIGKLK